MARVYLKGLPKLKAKLIKLRTQTEADLMPVMAKAGDEITAMMKRLVPVRTGLLRDSIGWRFGEAPKGSMKLGKFKSGSLTLTIYAGSRVSGGGGAFYAHLVEFGTQAHAISTPQGEVVMHPGALPHPFFYVSWRANKKKVKNMMSRAITKAVRNVSRT